MKTALVTGITGQDGMYLSEYLLQQGYRVYGLIRGQSNPKRPGIEKLIPDVELVEGDLLDQGSLIAAVEITAPDEIYNLGAISYVPLSWKQAELTASTTGTGVLRILEAIRIVNKQIRFYQASSSEMFGKVRQTPQSEDTPFYPRSPYGAAKAYGHYITVNYRESYGIYATSGICFNHESPRRGMEFVTRKISNAVARIKLGRQKDLVLGNLESKRDWGFAGDYVQAMHLMLQQPEPDDYVIATGQTHSVREFINAAFRHVGLDWQEYVRTDPKFLRPADVDLLVGDPTKAQKKMGWTATTDFEQLVRLMVDHDLSVETGRTE